MSTLVVAHKIRLNPNNAQKQYFCKACGTARFAYNWGLYMWKQQYSNGESPNTMQLKRLFRSTAKIDFPWVSEVTKCAAEQSFSDLAAAYRMFFKKVNSFPRFKKKGKSPDSFYISNDQFDILDKRIRIPKLGWVKMREAIRFSGKIMSARVSRTADQWHVAITVEIPEPTLQCESQARVGIDLGINTFAYLSDGKYVLAPKPLKKLQSKLAKLQKQHSRKKLNSQNRKKHTLKIARLHMRIANIRKDFLHKLTSKLVKNYKEIAIEDLHVKGMVRNHKLGKSISDASFGEFRRQLEYKGNWFNSIIHIVDRWFLSSKTCSQCGQVKDASPLSMRTYECDCGNNIDRDLNEAINLILISTGGLPGSYVCGQTHLWDPTSSICSYLRGLAEAEI